MNVLEIPPATPTEDRRALQEVEDFGLTDMGWGGDRRWTYRMLSEEQISPILTDLSQPKTHGLVDSVSFQPCLSYEARSQDRHVTQTWDLLGGHWTFVGVFDGHCSHETVEYAVDHLPNMVRRSLQSTLSGGPTSPTVISGVLRDAIIKLDDSITSRFLDIFPGGPDGLSSLSDSQLKALVNKPAQASQNFLNIIRCLRGTTVLVALVDPSSENLWVANLGDCSAVLVSKSSAGLWKSERINQIHNGDNDRELWRIANEHPGEDECVLDRRILGFLAPTRAVGNTWMKLPVEFSRRVFAKFRDFFDVPEECVARNLTPPYLSNVPDVYHHRLRKSKNESTLDMALVLCSDGLTDLYEAQRGNEGLSSWARIIGEGLRYRSPKGGERSNLALRLLRDAIGGNNLQKVSRNLTVEMDDRWMDDTTILVQRLHHR